MSAHPSTTEPVADPGPEPGPHPAGPRRRRRPPGTATGVVAPPPAARDPLAAARRAADDRRGARPGCQRGRADPLHRQDLVLGRRLGPAVPPRHHPRPGRRAVRAAQQPLVHRAHPGLPRDLRDLRPAELRAVRRRRDRLPHRGGRDDVPAAAAGRIAGLGSRGGHAARRLLRRRGQRADLPRHDEPRRVAALRPARRLRARPDRVPPAGNRGRGGLPGRLRDVLRHGALAARARAALRRDPARPR